ncbi:hypothetical protein RvY_04328 [Ramazzottius varieornatus]|uniref:Uncharacterized protein n=1 Tax=Ramazzottius varieornatus TaxID=947166 RepID=A0A1D1UR93_RAMVA|nr:hypothetical protein RvY_04328 [Ramazzottius varieornatus]
MHAPEPIIARVFPGVRSVVLEVSQTADSVSPFLQSVLGDYGEYTLPKPTCCRLAFRRGNIQNAKFPFVLPVSPYNFSSYFD